MCDKIISKLVTAAHTYGQSLATVVGVYVELQPEVSDLEGLTKWTAKLHMTGYGGLRDGEPEVVFKQTWTGSGEGIKDALVEAGKLFRGHLNAELFVHKQKCADAEMAIQEMDHEAVELWKDPEAAEQLLEKLSEEA